MTCSCPSVKGHFTNKSTAFSPSGGKYGTQSLVHDHMMSHYKRIEKAKSTIDNKPPKSMKNFIKAHSKRVQFKKQKERQLQLIEQMSRPSTAVPQSSNHEYTEPLPPRPASASWIERPRKNINIRKSMESLNLSLSRLNDDDLNHSFISQRSSTPISYKKASNLDVYDNTTPRYKVEMYAPEEEPTLIKGSFHNTSKMVMAASYWGSDKLNSSANSLLKGSVTPKKDSSDNLSPDDTFNHYRRNSRSFDQSSPQLDISPDQKRLQIQDELLAEEQAYLKFVEDITSDVLHRGIFSDRVLQQVFDTHIERRKGQLNEDRMKALINELKNDLGIQDVTQEDVGKSVIYTED